MQSIPIATAALRAAKNRPTEAEGVLCGFAGLIQSKHGEFQPVTRSRLAKDALQMPLHGVLADTQLRGDVSILHAPRHRVGDLTFAIRQAVQGGLWRWLGATRVIRQAADNLSSQVVGEGQLP